MQWSFGVTSWEVFTGGTIPYGGISPLALLQLLQDGERLSKPRNSACTDEMWVVLSLFYHLVPNAATRDFQTHDLEQNSIGSFVLMEVLKDLANLNPSWTSSTIYANQLALASSIHKWWRKQVLLAWLPSQWLIVVGHSANHQLQCSWQSRQTQHRLCSYDSITYIVYCGIQ